MKTLLTIYTLWQRELVRFYRQPSRVVGALASPLLFWVLIGSGIGTSFQGHMVNRSMNYLEFFFPGTLLMILLFTAIFSTISIIEDRREGFLQSVLVAPVPRSSIVFGKVLGGATLACSQAVLFLIAVPFLGLHINLWQFLAMTVVLMISAITLTSLGFIIAWKMNSIQGFHAIMNLFLMPLWMLSGALFPPEGASGWLRWMMKLNPLTYELTILRRILYGNNLLSLQLPSMKLSVTVMMIFGAIVFSLATYVVSVRDSKNLV
ncbi:MAG: multidrug ABC transporter permease [Candidatus Omnitrophica bacterium]|nr:multidrug ABC transporter permease [Candidatus Omnitrophota bacterium]